MILPYYTHLFYHTLQLNHKLGHAYNIIIYNTNL